MKVIHSIIVGALIASLIYNIFQYKVSRETETELTYQLDSVKTYAKELEVQQEILSAHIFDLEERNAAQDLVIQSRELEILKIRNESNRLRQKLNNIFFKSYTDSSRIEELKRLYPSLQ